MDEEKEKPKYQEAIIAFSHLTLGISIVVAVLIGVGIGILLKKWTGYGWLLWLGIFWGVAAAVLNVFKAYKYQQKELDELAKNPRYSHPKQGEDAS